MRLSYTRSRYGSLDAVVAQTDASSGKIPVILCHGYGAPGDDLVGCADELASLLESQANEFRFIFPAAPLSPPDLAMYGGRAWWEINMAKLLAASQSGQFDELHELTPPGIERATQSLSDAIQAAMDEAGVQLPYVLGGFSQGAMVTMNAVLTGPVPPPAILVQFSGTLVCKPSWETALQAGALAETQVLQSHGRLDTILPFRSAEQLRDLVKRYARNHRFIAFDGPHTIPMEAIMQLAVELKTLVNAS